MANAVITRERSEELLRFLPKLGTPGPHSEPEWHGLDQNLAGGMLFMPYPTYPREVKAFFRLAGQKWWTDFAYEPPAAGEIVRSDEAIASASLDRVKTLLTFCVRGERFCDGHWGEIVREGRVGAIHHGCPGSF
jgi:hypothetical protein